MIDPRFIGYEPPPHSVAVERNQLAFFAKAVGETDPVYFDEAAARAAGFKSVVMLPTFAFSLYNMQPDPLGLLNTLGVDLGRLLHGEQGLEFLSSVFAGDTVAFRSRVANLSVKKGGALEFIELHATGSNQDDREVFHLRMLYIVRHR